MSRSFTTVRRVLLGTSCAVTFGLGGTTLLATPQPARAAVPDGCSTFYCQRDCLRAGYHGGSCQGSGSFAYCVCGSPPGEW